MPSTNGMAFLEEIKMVRPGLPVVLMTGDIRESIKSKAAESRLCITAHPPDCHEVMRIIRTAL
jgi:DNA-binding NtrC family response regulator